MSILDDLGVGILGGGDVELGGPVWDGLTGILGGVSNTNDFTTAARMHEFERFGVSRGGAAELSKTRLGGPLQALAPLGLYSGLDQLFHGETWQDQVGGGLDAAGGGVGILELAGLEMGPIGPLLAAGKLGWDIGTEGNSIAQKRGYVGENEEGEFRNISQWWLDTASDPNTAQHAGPALLAGGAMALGSVLVEPMLDIAGVDAPISSRQQRVMNNQSHVTFDKLRQANMSEDAAENLAALSNPEFHEIRDRERSHASLVKSGLPPAVAQMLSGVR